MNSIKEKTDYIKEIEKILREEDIWNKNIIDDYNKKNNPIEFFKKNCKKPEKKDHISITKKQIEDIKDKLGKNNEEYLNRILLASKRIKKNEKFEMSNTFALIQIFLAVIPLIISPFINIEKNIIFVQRLYIAYLLIILIFFILGLGGYTTQEYQTKGIAFNNALYCIQIATKELLNSSKKKKIKRKYVKKSRHYDKLIKTR